MTSALDGSAGVRFTVEGRPYFSDSEDHWHNAVLRLLGLGVEAGSTWVSDVCATAARAGSPLWDLDPEVAVAVLRDASAASFPPPPAVVDRGAVEAGDLTLWAASVGPDTALAMVGRAGTPHARLVDAATLEPLDIEEEFYEEGYFEGAVDNVGYQGYLDQSDWRLEKAARQVREVVDIARFAGHPLPPAPRALDIGSGYGFFRHAAGQAGWGHEGVEVSSFGAEQAERLFGFTTFTGTLDKFAATAPQPFDVAVMWDCLEHVPDPEVMLATARDLLVDGGLLLVRTPNLLAVELEVFGGHYHSLKREHLHMFSPGSLGRAMVDADLEPVFTQTSAHLLRGFLGPLTGYFATTLRGSDILAAGRRSLVPDAGSGIG